jgi:hypothetical protein
MTPIQSAWASLRTSARVALPLVITALSVVVILLVVIRPIPPRNIVLASGQLQGAFHDIDAGYARQLRKAGIEVEVRHTSGTLENLALLNEGRVDAALMIDGVINPGSPDSRLRSAQSLGTLTRLPLWIFYRESAAQRAGLGPQLNHLGQMKGWAIDIGPDRSSSQAVMHQLLTISGMSSQTVTKFTMDQVPSALKAGHIDAACFFATETAPAVRELLGAPGVRLLDMAQTDGYTRRIPHLSTVVLPRGLIDLATDQPETDLHLLAATVSLVVSATAHPTLQHQLMEAASLIHQPGGWFQQEGEFPQRQAGTFPLSEEAEHHFRNGPPHRPEWMPFWLASLLDRNWMALISLLAILLPVLGLVPPLYTLRVRSRIFRWYERLRRIEREIGRRKIADLRRLLDDIEMRVLKVDVPVTLNDELYTLLSHIDLIRLRLDEIQSASQPAAPSTVPTAVSVMRTQPPI